MQIRPATSEDLELVHRLAVEIWWPTYHAILPADQITFMLEDMYSVEALEQQFSEGLRFVLAESEGRPVGFMGFINAGGPEGIFRLEKLYILPSEQGRGTGRALIGYANDLALKDGAKILELNVNRSNPAFIFYQRAGFTIYREADIPYHRYVLNDYIMRRPAEDKNPGSEC